MQADCENPIGTASGRERSKGNSSVSTSIFFFFSRIKYFRPEETSVQKGRGGLFSVKTDKQGSKLIHQLGNQLQTRKEKSL